MCSFFWQGMENDHGELADVVRASQRGGSRNNPLTDCLIPLEPTNLPSTIGKPVDNFGDPFLNIRDPLLHELELAGSSFLNGTNSAASPVKMNTEESDSSSSSSSSSFFAQRTGDEEMMRSNSEVQISSARNPGIKRRKSQVKQVVCIPAPAAASSRSSGEVVPSDLWAWRKYGQKPIKGSPYPRGYYRCSSSKGCSARKQVERSRNDPTMLVITYTSEHNHPWPTQRNALAGSIRSQPVKNNAGSKASPSTKLATLMEEDADNASSATTAGGSSTSGGTVKEEMGEREKQKPIDIQEFDQSSNHNYRPMAQDYSRSEDFFADLEELEPDPLNLIFSQGLAAGKSDEERVNRAFNPFNFFDCSGR